MVEKSVNQQIADSEKDIDTKLKALEVEYQKVKIELKQTHKELKTILQIYETLLVSGVELAITIANYEQVLKVIRDKRNPSVR